MRLSDVPDLGGFGLRPVTGLGLMDRRIDWVYTTDLIDPRRYLAGGELVLTSGGWYRHPEDPDRFVRSLARGRAAGLVAGDVVHGHLPEPLIDACDRHRLPLFAAPAHVSYGQLTRVIIERLSDDRARSLADLVQAQRGLALAAVGYGLAGITAQVAAATGRPCAVLSPTGRRVLGSPGAAEAYDRDTAHALAATARGRGRHGLPLYRPVDGRVATILPTGTHGTPAGYLVCGTDLLDGPENVRALVDLAAALCTPEMTSASASASASASIGDDAGDGPVLMLSYAVDGDRPDSAHAFDIAAELCDGLGGYHESGGTVCAAFDGDADTALRTVRANAELLGSCLPDDTRCAVGMAVAPTREDRERAAREAGTLRGMAADRPGAVSVLDGASLDPVRLLCASMPDEMRTLLHEHTLGPLLAYDRRNGTGLVETLRAFLECDASWQRCAERLHLHVNTLHYRISRIEQLTGRSLRSLEDRVQLYLALHA
ncbi:MAG: hypothetical protein HOV68_30270 [Streptomycetaceae bacterium]|nr:hypothetical protein [Streptomycetaceae bacterium]